MPKSSKLLPPVVRLRRFYYRGNFMNRTFIPSGTRNVSIKKLPGTASLTGMFLLFILPLALLLYNELHEIHKWVEFTQRERIGLEYNRSLRKLMEDLMQHRGMTNAYLSGDGSFTERIEIEHSEIKNDIREVDALNGKYGRLLNTDDKWEAFKESWQEREHTEYTLSSGESFDSHTAMIADIMALMSHVGETSNLILDPELTTHYLMDSVTFKLPVLAENIGQARAVGVRAAVKRKYDEGEKRRFIVLAGLIRSSYAEVDDRVQKVLKSDSDLDPRLARHVEGFSVDIKNFLDTFDREIISADTITINARDYYETVTKAIDVGFNLYDKKASLLDRLLWSRIHAYEREKYLFGFALMVMSGLFIYTFTGFRRNLSKLQVAEEGLRRQVEFERLITSISGAFIDFSTADTDRTINEALQRMGEFAEANRSYVFLFSDDSSRMDNAYEWCAEGTEPAAEKFKSLWVSDFPWSTRKLKDSEIVHIKNADDFPPDAEGEKNLFLARGNKSFVLVPMMNRERMIGFLGFDSVRAERGWMESDIELLKTVGNILVNTLERREADKRLVHLAVTDPLTQIYNRLKFNNALDIEIQRATRHKRIFSLMMFDIDHFKDVNDSFGHEVGDETLKTLTNIVSRHVRVTDTFARWGGEEFVILVVETPAEGGRMFAEKLRKEIEETSFGIAGKITCSFGVTQFKVTDDITSIIKRVDEALYEAKKTGRNRACIR